MALRPSDDNAGRGRTARSYPFGPEGSLSGGVTLRAWHAVAVLALATFVIRWPWLAGDMTIPWDAKAHFQPQIQFLAKSIADGQSPFWAPYYFSGHPQIADPQAMIFSPPFLLLSMITAEPGAWSIDATVIAVVFLGGCALMLWFHDQSWHWAGGLMAALVFCYGASMAWRLQHTGQVLSLAYLPIAMLCLDRALGRRSIFYGAAAGAVAAFIVLGRDQVALLAIYFLAGFALWRLLSAPAPLAAIRTGFAPLAAGALAAIALLAIPILLTLLLAAESNRPSIDFIGAGRGSLHPALLLTLLAPDLFGAAGRMEDYWGPPSFAWADTGIFLAQNMGQLYIGAIPLLLLLMGALRGRLWSGEIRFFTVAAIVTLLYALGWYTPVFRILYEIAPGVALYRRPADATFLLGALAAILAGYSTHRVFSNPDAPLPRSLTLATFSVIGTAFGVAISVGIWLGHLPQLASPLAIGILSFCIGAAALLGARQLLSQRAALAGLLLAFLTTADLAFSNGPGSATAQPRAMYEVLEPRSTNATIALLKEKIVHGPARRDRVELAGLGFHWPNASLTHRLENTLGYNPVRLRLYSEATGADDTVGLPDQRKFPPLFPSYRSTLANLLGLRFIVTGEPIEKIDPKLKPGDFRPVAKTADGYVYENTAAFDRVLFATQDRKADFERILKEGTWPEVDLRSTVLLENAAEISLRPPGTAKIVSYRNTEILIEANSPSGGWVVLNDPWHPWWFADIDGKATDILRANVLFRAVAVPPGQHMVRFTFRPLAGAWAQLTGYPKRYKGASLDVHTAFSAPVTSQGPAGPIPPPQQPLKAPYER